jgi:hypothetical protein
MITGDFMAPFTPDNGFIDRTQQAVKEGLIEQIVVYFVNQHGWAKDHIALRFDPLGQDDKVIIDTSGGRSAIEAFEVGMAGMVDYAVKLMSRKRLRPEVRLFWSAKANSNPALLDEACQRLNFVKSAGNVAYAPDPVSPEPVNQPVSYQPGYAPRKVLSLTAGKDSGVHMDISTSRRVR